MKLSAMAVVGAAAGVIGVLACGERIEAGLANAPSIERKSEPRQQYDVITGGEEGCTNRDGGPTIASAAGGCRSIGVIAVADASGDPSGTR
jgi:hypothetical protein